MGPKPFVRLAALREVNRPDFPTDLVRFYAENEAVEFTGTEYGSLYLLPLRDVKRVRWEGLGYAAEYCPKAWREFEAFHIGGGLFFEKIVYVLSAPCCQPGAILAVGGNLPTGGAGDHGVESCMVLAASFSQWLWHLEEYGWWEYAIGFGIPELPVQRRVQLRAYYLALNPNMDWPEP